MADQTIQTVVIFRAMKQRGYELTDNPVFNHRREHESH